MWSMDFLHQNNLKHLLKMKIPKTDFRPIKSVSLGWEQGREKKLGNSIFQEVSTPSLLTVFRDQEFRITVMEERDSSETWRT